MEGETIFSSRACLSIVLGSQFPCSRARPKLGQLKRTETREHWHLGPCLVSMELISPIPSPKEKDW